MPRKPKSTTKSIYTRIEEKQQQIKETEAALAILHDELHQLEAERDEEEMRRIFEAVKDKGLTVEETIAILTADKK